MSAATSLFTLECPSDMAAAPVLVGVQASGSLDGLLFDLTLRQTYRNDSEHPLEVVYTFPLADQAVLLGFAAELNGSRKAGVVVAKAQAERRYEAAFAEGDAPVMLEALSGGLHTANIGNLAPGDRIVIEVRVAQLLTFEQGRLRLTIPSTVAPRYGNSQKAGLQAQQVPSPSLLVQYPLTLTLDVLGELAGASIECPTHSITRTQNQDGLRIELAADAWLDRDLVLVVVPPATRTSFAIAARDSVAGSALGVTMAALQPPPAPPRARIALKVLVDCSGSMAGDSIASARRALHGALESLTAHDQISISRFGSTVEHVAAPGARTPRALRELEAIVDAIDADMGGTEMQQALEAVFRLTPPEGRPDADVLLITDGEIWQTDSLIASAQASRHRIFAIGVGSSPAHALLRSMAEATGGACEFATPGEALEAAAGRMLTRIRQEPWRDVRIDWGTDPVWQTPLPAAVFGGDTVLAFAGLPATCAAAEPAVRLLAIDAQGQTVLLAQASSSTLCANDALPRIAAARRMAHADSGTALQLAVAYQLMSSQTNCILVHQRADAAKVVGEAQLHRVSSMLAAGWGGSASIMQSAAPSAPQILACYDDFDPTTGYSPLVALRSNRPAVARAPEALQPIAQAVAAYLLRSGGLAGLADHCRTLAAPDEIVEALCRTMAAGSDPDQAWLLLAHWIVQRTEGPDHAQMAATLRPMIDALPTEWVEECLAEFDRHIGRWAGGARKLSRMRRLRNAMNRVAPRAR